MPEKPAGKGISDPKIDALKEKEAAESFANKDPEDVLRNAGDKLRPHTAVANEEEAPGPSSSDRAAGTSVPVADRADNKAVNAGATAGGRKSTDTGRMSFRSSHGKRLNLPSLSGSGASGRGGKQPHSSLSGSKSSASSPKHLRIADTETIFATSSIQEERSKRVIAHINEEPRSVQQVQSPGNVASNPRQFYAGVQSSLQDSGETFKDASETLNDAASDTKSAAATAGAPAGATATSGTEGSTGKSAGASEQDATAAFFGGGVDRIATTPLPVTDGKKADDDEEEEQPEEYHRQLESGQVPGLEVGKGDPGFPGQIKKKGKTAKKPEVTPNLDAKVVEKKYGTRKQALSRQRKLQAEFTGWRQIGGWDNDKGASTEEEAEDMLQRSTLLEHYVSDKYIGDWYQNTILVIGTATAAWLLGHFGFSVSWLSIVLLFSATAYRTSIRRLRRNLRDDLVRDQSVRDLENDAETMEWLNSFMVKFWLIYEPSLSAMITDIANDVLADQTPGFIDSLKLDKFTLGTKAPRIDFMRSFPKTDPTVAVIDVGASFTPNDTQDLTSRQLETKVNPKVQLGVRFGKGPLTKNMPILVEDMSFVGNMRLRIKMMDKFPHIQTVDFSFLEPPQIDFVLKPIGGEKLGFDINIIPGLSKFIKEMVDANLGPMFYSPNAFQVNVEQLMAGVGVMSGVGVLSVRINRAHNLKIDADGRVDAYVRLLNKDKKELCRTKIKQNTNEPVWNEYLHAIITNLSESVIVEVMDFQESAFDRSIGSTAQRVDKLSPDAVTQTIISGGRPSGKLELFAKFSPVQMATSEDGDESESSGDSKSGILGLRVISARSLDPKKSKVAKLSPYCEIEVDGELLDSTKLTKGTNDPEWGYGKEHIFSNKITAQVVFRIRDNRKGNSPVVGIYKTRLMKLLVDNEKGINWFELENGAGEINIETQWKPATVLGSTVDSYIEPIGVLRLRIVSADDLRNLEHVGKVDPYCKVLLGRREVARTEFFKGELSPQWNEIKYIPVQNELQDVTFEVMDVERRGKDRSLGAFKVDLSSIIQKNEEGNYKVFISDKHFTNKLVMPGRGPKGNLTYTMEFYPNIPVASPDERDRMCREKVEIDRIRKEAVDGKKLDENKRNELELRENRLALAGIDMPVEKQLEFNSGVFAVSFLSLSNVPIGCRLVVLANNIELPIYVSPPARGRRVEVEGDSGDFVSGQLNFSNLRFILCESDDGSAPISEKIVGCFEMMREAFTKPQSYKIGNSTLEVQCRMFPLPDLVVDQDEDMTNTGTVEVELLRAENVPAADRSGLSDPYVRIYVNNDDDRIYSSEVKKETLNPEWNERFSFDIADAHNTFFKAMVYDWDMGNPDDLLGGHKFNISELEPLEWKDYAVNLLNLKPNKEVKHEKEVGGVLYLRMRFAPGFLQKKKGEDIIGLESVQKVAGGAGKLAMGGGKMALGAAGAGAGVAGGAAGAVVGHGGSLFKKFGGSDKASLASTDEDANTKKYLISVENIQGVSKGETVQIRCFTLGKKEKEVFKSKSLKLEEGEVEVGETFEVKALPESTLGLKLLSIKSLGRHSDIGQSSVELSNGEKTASFGGGTTANLSIEQMN